MSYLICTLDSVLFLTFITELIIHNSLTAVFRIKGPKAHVIYSSMVLIQNCILDKDGGLIYILGKSSITEKSTVVGFRVSKSQAQL